MGEDVWEDRHARQQRCREEQGRQYKDIAGEHERGRARRRRRQDRRALRDVTYIMHRWPRELCTPIDNASGCVGIAALEP